MEAITTQDQAQSPKAILPQLRLPHPYLTTFGISAAKTTSEQKEYQLLHVEDAKGGLKLPFRLHNEYLFFSELVYGGSESLPLDSDNSSWARARRTPFAAISWTLEQPTVGQLWLTAYALLTLHPLLESIKIVLSGIADEDVGAEAVATGLFVNHPVPSNEVSAPQNEYLLLRGCFWQGAGCPFGSRAIWAPKLNTANEPLTAEYPAFPLHTAPTTRFPAERRHTHHPIRPSKPQPGSIIYSRWVPHLKEHFSMVALDYKNAEHLGLFHKWQNDPRVAKGWNETGTVEQHREYLRRLHEDPHVLTILARFEDVFFAYFEVYWAKEDHMGAHYHADDFDRGRHSLVGDERFRGPHRVSVWWCALMHYMFLDDYRTMFLVGEPKATNSTVLAYDFVHGFHIERLVDLPHKRSAFMRCSREKFFQLSPFVWDGEAVIRPSLDPLAKL